MAQITKIDKQVKNKNRINIYLDGEFCLGCEMDIMLRFGLKVGLEITPERLNQIAFENERGLALSRVLNLLSKTIKTVRQVKTYLREKQYSQEIIDHVINKLTEYNYLDDKNYARLYVKSVSAKYGKHKIINELKNKGVCKEDIEVVMQEYEPNNDVVFDLAVKHFRNKENTQENINKTYRYLISRGFDYDSVGSAIKKIKLEMLDGNRD